MKRKINVGKELQILKNSKKIQNLGSLLGELNLAHPEIAKINFSKITNPITCQLQNPAMGEITSGFGLLSKMQMEVDKLEIKNFGNFLTKPNLDLAKYNYGNLSTISGARSTCKGSIDLPPREPITIKIIFDD